MQIASRARALRPSQPALLLSIYVVGGSLITIFQRYLTLHYDTATQNGCRFFAGALGLLLIAFLFRRAELFKTLRDWRQMGSLFLLSLSSVVPSALGLEGLRHTSAVMAGLISILGVPLTVGLAVLFFADERQAARGPRFLLGALLALGGMIGLSLGGSAVSFEYSLGVLYLLLATLIGSAGGLLTKRLVITSEPFTVSGLSTLFTSLAFLAFSVATGGIASVAQAPLISNVILFGSGVYGLLIGGGVYMLIIRQSGLIAARFADLVAPVFIGIFGFLIFGELLTPLQIVFGVVLMAGCVLILSKRASVPV
jgi:drug/metabolite transporter (DMT)-like permease